MRVPGAALGVNQPLVVLWMILVLVNLLLGALRVERDFRIVRIGLVILVVSVANDNLVSLGLLPWQVRGEPLGIVIFISILGYALALRAFGNERRLATLDYELRTAHQIQQSLLPRELPRAVGESLAVRYIPMAPSAATCMTACRSTTAVLESSLRMSPATGYLPRSSRRWSRLPQRRKYGWPTSPRGPFRYQSTLVWAGRRTLCDRGLPVCRSGQWAGANTPTPDIRRRCCSHALVRRSTRSEKAV